MFSLRAYFLLLLFVCTKAFPQAIGYTRIDIPANTLILEKLVLLPLSSNKEEEKTVLHSSSPNLRFTIPSSSGSNIFPKKIHPGYYLVEVSDNGVANAVLAKEALNYGYRPRVGSGLAIAIVLALFLLYGSIGYYIYAVKNNALRKVNQNHERILQIIAHDLRSPLHHYHGLGEILQELIKNREYDRLEKVGYEIEGASHKLKLLMNNLRVWNFLPKQKKEHCLDEIHLTGLLREILPIYTLIAASRTIEIHNSVDDEVFFKNDKAIISLIIRNLIDNAVKHSPAGSDILISADHKSGTWALSVKNRYDAADKKHIEKIADFFNHGCPPDKYQYTGSGLRFIKEFTEIIKGHIMISFEERYVAWTLNLPTKT